jgi:signal transduction histidine kinase
VIAIAGVTTVAVVLFAVPLGVVLGRSYRDKELLRLQSDTVSATKQVDLGASAGDRVELPASQDALAVYDRAGRRVAGRGPLAADAVVREAIAAGKPANRSADGKLVAAAPLVKAERVTGALRAARDDATVTREARDAWLALAGLAAGLIVAATLAAILLGGRLARPLERLGVDARRLGEGDFTVRSPRAGIPEVDAVGSALDATARRLDDLVSRERAFSADASHQLRTPLAALRIEIEGMQIRHGDLPELKAAIAQIDRLQATVDMLLAVARDAPRRSGRSDIVALLDELEARWRGLLAASGRPLRVLVRAEAPTARASGTVVTEILDVLMSNAQRHGAGEVRITVRDVDAAIAIDVQDEGRGFSTLADDAFTRRAGGGDGHGIGLALARSLAEAEGGRLRVTRPGSNPVVTLVLRGGPDPGA